MEAPEKLYLSKNIYSTYLYQVPDPDDETVVEYIREDAFIEKLKCWLNEKGREYYGEFDEGFLTEFKTSEEAIEDFKKYMEGGY